MEKNQNLNEIKKELLEDVIPNLKKYKEQGKDVVLLKGIAIGLKIAKEEKIAWGLFLVKKMQVDI